MKRKILKKIILIIVCFLVLIGIGLLVKKYITKKQNENLTNYDWLNKNVEIVLSDDFGYNIYYVNKDNGINIYNDNYRKVIDEKYAKINNSDFTFDKPLIIYNLYGTNVLSFNIEFNTEEQSYLSYTVSVDDINDFTKVLKNNGNNNLTTNHQYQLIGFVPGYLNILTLELRNKDDEIIDTKEIEIDLRNIEINSEIILDSENGDSSVELTNGLYTLLGNDSDNYDYVSLYDNDGVIRGEIPIIGYRAHSILFKDNIMYFSISQTKIVAMNNLGRVEEIYQLGDYHLHHDYVFDDDGNILVLANNTTKDTEEDCIIKIDLETKEVIEVLDLENIFTSYVETCLLDTESVRDEGEDGLDWIHINSIEYIDGNIILSSRETSSIIKINDIYDEPKLEYILADSALWENTEYSDYVYNKIGDFKIHAGQHSVRYSGTNDKDIYYLIFYNNNYGKQTSQPSFDYSKIGIDNDNPFNGDESYYYVYKVNEKEKSFELIDSFSVEYSGIVSSVQTMDNGNIIIDSGTKGIYGEYDEDHNLIKKFNVKLNKYMLYRVLKYDFNDYWYYEK